MSRYRLVVLILGLGTLVLLGASSETQAAPEGTLTFALHYKPRVELVLEAFEGYWRKTPSIKRLVFRVLPYETKLKRP